MSLVLELEVAFKEATVKTGIVRAVNAPATASDIWANSLTGILKLVLDKALELGREHRDDIEVAAKRAVDALAALDLPWIPEGVENTLDAATKAAGYKAVEALLEAVLGV